MKRGLLGFPLLILLIQVISAQFYSGYGGFSLGEFFDRIDPQTIILVLLFLIFFALIFYALSRIFKDPYGQPNKGIAGTIAFCISAIIIYGLYRTGFDIGNIFYDWGFSVGSLYPILSIVFLIVAGLLIWKLKVGGFLMTFGLFILLLTAFTDIFYEKGLPLLIGIISLVLGLLLWRRSRGIMRGVGRGVWRTGRGIGKGVGWTGKRTWGAIKKKRGARRQRRQQEEQRTQTRRGIRGQTHDTINEIRRIDMELRSIPRRIGAANRQGNREQAMMLEQERIRLRQQRRELEREIRRFRREHSSNI